MEAQLEQIREQQKESWNKFSAGWKKWDDLTMDFLQPMGDAIVDHLNPRNGEVVLDVAAGTGEPGLTIAARLRGGRVVVTDLADDMLAIARENAARRGIRNIETRTCDVSELPFADNYFDAISCRFGFMFFPDMTMAAAEMYRVLKPGGKIAAAVWGGPEKNFWVTAIMGAINRKLELPPPPSGAPGMFRCAKEGLMADLFSQAGFKNVAQQEVSGQLNCQTVDVYWDMMTEIAAPVVAGLSKADEGTQAEIKAEVYQAVRHKYPQGDILIASGALVISGEK